jgi:hypothetical protein
MVRALILISGIILVVTSIIGCLFLFTSVGQTLASGYIDGFPKSFFYWIFVSLFIPIGIVGVLLIIEGVIMSRV